MATASREHQSETLELIDRHVRIAMRQKRYLLQGDEILLIMHWLRDAWAEIDRLKQEVK